jgi:methanogenic corrinoid protein MtbC1
MPAINQYPDTPLFKIKIVSQKTGVEEVTLRAWERRYKVFAPQRGANGYRLYSEKDLALILWLKQRINSGIPIRAAAEEFKTYSSRGISPEVALPSQPTPLKNNTKPASAYATSLYNAFLRHDEVSSLDVITESFESFDLLPFFEKVILPVMIKIGNDWYNGKILVTTEHFASSLIRARLMSIFQSLAERRTSEKILVGCAPGELHEVGPLMFSILLRDAGFAVEYLGPDIPLEDLVLYANNEKPFMVILSVTLNENAKELQILDGKFKQLRRAPIFGYGGPAFVYSPELIAATPGVFLGATLTQSIETVNQLSKLKKKGK